MEGNYNYPNDPGQFIVPLPIYLYKDYNGYFYLNINSRKYKLPDFQDKYDVFPLIETLHQNEEKEIVKRVNMFFNFQKEPELYTPINLQIPWGLPEETPQQRVLSLPPKGGTPTYTATKERLDGRIVYCGPRGGKYIKSQGTYVSIRKYKKT